MVRRRRLPRRRRGPSAWALHVHASHGPRCCCRTGCTQGPARACWALHPRAGLRSALSGCTQAEQCSRVLSGCVSHLWSVSRPSPGGPGLAGTTAHSPERRTQDEDLCWCPQALSMALHACGRWGRCHSCWQVWQAQARTLQSNLKAGSVWRVAHKRVGHAEGQRVHRPAGRHAHAPQPGAPRPVLRASALR